MKQNSSSPSDTVSSQKSLPSSHDSGWNDPPVWALSSHQSPSGTERSTKKLNKRVAFPLSSQTSTLETTIPPPLSNLPPILQPSTAPTITTAPHKPFVAPIDLGHLVAETSESTFDKDHALTEVLSYLESVMTEQNMEKDKVEEIQRRLSTMKSDWLENKLNNMIQRNILDLSKALLRKDIEQADKIHIALMTQHATVCRTWVPAIRQIIFELKKKYETSNVLQVEQSPLLSVELKK